MSDASNTIMQEPPKPFTEEEITLAMSTAVGALDGFVESIRQEDLNTKHVEFLAHKVAEMIISEHVKGHVTY